MGRRSRDYFEQEEITDNLIMGMETMDSDEFEELYDKLDISHQEEVDRAIRDFADGAIGDEHWDSDD